MRASQIAFMKQHPEIAQRIEKASQEDGDSN
jgi:hypothetical protein